jgi:hypothetical protein
MKDLKPCPHCPDGGQPKLATALFVYWVHCMSCEARGPEAQHKPRTSHEKVVQKAIDLWNNRPHERS